MRHLISAFLLFIVLLSPSLSIAQPPPIKNLIFEGAGMRGIAYCGALQVLEEGHMLDSLKQVSGTSAGAITAAFYCLGYSSAEMERIIFETDFAQFNDGRFAFVGGMMRMHRSFGWYRGIAFDRWLHRHIEAKTGDGDITLAAFEEWSNYRFSSTATSISEQRWIELSAKTYPNMRLKDAVRISITVPLYFEAVFVNEDGQTFRKQSASNDRDILVDGGVLNNFPIHLCDAHFVDSLGRECREPNPHTLGIRMDEEAQIGQDKLDRNLVRREVHTTKQFVSAFYNVVIEQLNRPLLTVQDWQRTVAISTGGVAPKIGRMPEETRLLLINNGREAMEEYLRRQDDL